jgi:carbon storage regulator CsrA
MLCLTRLINETVILQVGDVEISVKILATARGRIKLGFTAPDEVAIWRSELLDRERDAD